MPQAVKPGPRGRQVARVGPGPDWGCCGAPCWGPGHRIAFQQSVCFPRASLRSVDHTTQSWHVRAVYLELRLCPPTSFSPILGNRKCMS